MKKIVIYGAGGLGKEIRALIQNINKSDQSWSFEGFYDDQKMASSETEIIGGMDKLNAISENIYLAIAIGDPIIKKQIHGRIHNENVMFATLIHPNVSFGNLENISIGEGSIICAGCTLTTDITVGDHSLINLNSTVGHDVKIGNYSSVMPGCNIAGEVQIGQNVFVGSGSNIINGLTVGDNVTIGAGAVVIKDVASKSTAVGVPAQIIKKHA